MNCLQTMILQVSPAFAATPPHPATRYTICLLTFITMICPLATSDRSMSCKVSGGSPQSLRRRSNDISLPAAPAWAIMVATLSAAGASWA